MLGLARKAAFKLLLSQASLNPYYNNPSCNNNNKYSCYGSNYNLSCMVFGHIIIYNYITFSNMPVLGIRVGAMNPLNFKYLSYLMYWKTFISISAPRTNQMDLFNFLVSTRKLCFEQVLGHELAYQLIYTFDYVFHRMKIFLGRQEVDGFVQETSE